MIIGKRVKRSLVRLTPGDIVLNNEVYRIRFVQVLLRFPAICWHIMNVHIKRPMKNWRMRHLDKDPFSIADIET